MDDIEKNEADILGDVLNQLDSGMKQIQINQSEMVYKINALTKDVKNLNALKIKINQLVGRIKAPTVARQNQESDSQFDVIRKIVLDAFNYGHKDLHPLMITDLVFSDRFIKVRCSGLKAFKYSHIGSTMAIDAIIEFCLNDKIIEQIHDKEYLYSRYGVKSNCYRVINSFDLNSMKPANSGSWG